MAPELEKPRVTEIQVRMDCNGCVQKIKKALHGINGIYDLYIDFPHQKITIMGWADPEKIVKAIKKTRKSAIICSHTEQVVEQEQPAQPMEETASEGGAPAPEPANPPPAEAPPAEAAQTPEPPKDPPPPENPPQEAKPSSATAETSASQPAQPSGPRDVEEVHVIYHHPPDYGYRYGYDHSTNTSYGGQWGPYPSGPAMRHEHYQQPMYVTHSYNNYRPSPYVTGYEYVPPSPPPYMPYHIRPEPYNNGYYSGNRGNGNITSIFSDENPNACTIV